MNSKLTIRVKNLIFFAFSHENGENFENKQLKNKQS